MRGTRYVSLRVFASCCGVGGVSQRSGAHADDQWPQSKQTPLMLATRREDKVAAEVIKTLIAYGADAALVARVGRRLA